MTRAHRYWSADEDRRLRNMWGELTVAEIAARLHRTDWAIWARARLVGLPLGAPHGCETLSAAAVRVGLADAAAVKSVCRWAGVRIRQSMNLTTGTAYVHQVVDRFELDEAMRLWCASETVTEAARRLGMNPQTLRRRLVAAKAPYQPRKRREWRLPSSVIDSVVGARRAA